MSLRWARTSRSVAESATAITSILTAPGSNDLRSSTQGRGNFTMHFSRYEQLPGNLATEIKAARGIPAEDED